MIKLIHVENIDEWHLTSVSLCTFRITLEKYWSISSQLNHMKNSWVEWDSASHAFGGRSWQLISKTLKPRMQGSVTVNPRGSYTLSFCSAMNFDTFRRHCNNENHSLVMYRYSTSKSIYFALYLGMTDELLKCTYL